MTDHTKIISELHQFFYDTPLVLDAADAIKDLQADLEWLMRNPLMNCALCQRRDADCLPHTESCFPKYDKDWRKTYGQVQ